MRYAWIDQLRSEYSLHRLCSVLEVSRSGYYKHRDRRLPARAVHTATVVRGIMHLAELHHFRYGSPRLTVSLQTAGVPCSINTVARLMAIHGLGARKTKRYRITTRQDPTAKASPNLLEQYFHCDEINRIWLTDITYIHTDEGWLFLTAVLDLASRRVVGWSIQTTLEQHGALQALLQALGRRRPQTITGKSLTLHSDRGSQFTSRAFRQVLKDHHLTQSMSGKGNCYDNAPMESFFGTLKEELVHRQHYATRQQARESIADYIELYYNTERLHSALNCKSPAEWERQFTHNSRND